MLTQNCLSGNRFTSNGFGAGDGRVGGTFVSVVDGNVVLVIGTVSYCKVMIELVVTSALDLRGIGVVLCVGVFVDGGVFAVAFAVVLLVVVAFVVELVAIAVRGALVVVARLVVVLAGIELADVVVFGTAVVSTGFGTHSGTGKSHTPPSMHDKKPSPFTTVSFTQ